MGYCGEKWHKNAGLGLFAAARFHKDGIVTIYFTPQKSKTPPTTDKFTAFKYGHFHTVPIMDNGQPPYYIGAHLINNATWGCQPRQVKNLKRSNNCHWDQFLIRAKSLIKIGEELFLGYNDAQYTHEE